MPASRPVQLSLPVGEGLRDVALVLLGRHSRLIDGLRAVAKLICETDGQATASKVRSMVVLPKGVSHNVMGHVFRHPMFEFVGWEKSTQPQAHARHEGLWRLRNGATG
jgi:hypothetical protein